MGEKSRWYSNLEVKKAISEQMQNREAIWMQVAPSRDKPFWVRKSRAESPQSVQYWLDSLGYQYNGVGAFKELILLIGNKWIYFLHHSEPRVSIEGVIQIYGRNT